MDGKLGKQYLLNHIKKSGKSFDKIFERKIALAKKIDTQAAVLLWKFYKLAKRGKRIRGSLMTLGYKVSGGKKTEIIKASSLIEIFHAAVLTQDDIQDNDDSRRGMLALHKQFQNYAKKTNALDPDHTGISLTMDTFVEAYYLSWEILMASKFDLKSKIEAGKVYANYIQRLAQGQSLDIHNPKGQDSESAILKVLRLKSAEYTAVLPLLLGAALAGEKNKRKINALKTYGRNFGVAFQIQDDHLDIFGNSKMRKPAGSDIEEGKNTLFTLYLSKLGTKKQKEPLKLLGKPNLSRTNLKKIQTALKESGAYQTVIDIGWKHIEKAKKQIPKITKDKKLADTLESLAVYMMERTL